MLSEQEEKALAPFVEHLLQRSRARALSDLYHGVYDPEAWEVSIPPGLIDWVWEYRQRRQATENGGRWCSPACRSDWYGYQEDVIASCRHEHPALDRAEAGLRVAADCLAAPDTCLGCGQELPRSDFPAYTLARGTPAEVAPYLGFGSQLVGRQIGPYLVVGLTATNGAWQQGRLHSGLRGGAREYATLAAAVAAAFSLQ